MWILEEDTRRKTYSFMWITGKLAPQLQGWKVRKDSLASSSSAKLNQLKNLTRLCCRIRKLSTSFRRTRSNQLSWTNIWIISKLLLFPSSPWELTLLPPMSTKAYSFFQRKTCWPYEESESGRACWQLGSCGRWSGPSHSYVEVYWWIHRCRQCI